MAERFEQEALAALREYEAAMREGNVAAQLAFFADDWRSGAGRTKAGMAAGLEDASARAVNAQKRLDVSAAEVLVEGSVATIDPVTIRSPTGGGFMRFVLRRTPAGKWQCISLAGSQATDTAAEQARGLRERLLADRSRPGYHFVMPEGVAMPFDPNGAIYWQGRYHLFYIFQDTQLGRRADHWGHVSSTDLYHWRHHPTGLLDGMYSGNCFLNHAGAPTMCYHQVGKGNAMAVALDDDLNEWRKLPSAITPPDANSERERRYRSWDPFGWLEGDTYYAIFGGKAPAIAKAPALEGPWRYVGDLFAHGVAGVALDEDVSCADFFRLGNVDVLLCISHRLGCRYYLGEWREEQFHPASHGRMSWVDNTFFAPESLVDEKGRRIMWAWILDEPEFGARRGAGWSGTLSLPRVLSIGDDGGLRIEVAEEIEALRYGGMTTALLTTEGDEDVVVDGVAGDSLELRVELESQGASAYGVKVCASPDGQDETAILYNAEEKALQVDTRRAGPASAPGALESAPLTLRPGEPLQLRIFIDKSVVEVFANGRQAVARRLYPSRQDSVGVRVFSTGGTCRHKLAAWRIAPSNPF